MTSLGTRMRILLVSNIQGPVLDKVLSVGHLLLIIISNSVSELAVL